MERKTKEDTDIEGLKAGTSYKSITMPAEKEFVFHRNFNDVQVPSTGKAGNQASGGRW